MGEITEAAKATAGELRLSDAGRRVLTDLAASEDMPAPQFMSRRYVSTFRDFVRSRDELLAHGLIVVVETVPRITEAGRVALRGAR